MSVLLLRDIYIVYWFQGADIGLEHHLHRGRALAALNHLLSARIHKLKSETPSSGQTNVQSDVQILLAPIIESEESLLSSVRINAEVNTIIFLLIPTLSLWCHRLPLVV